MKKLKQGISLLLAFCMCLSLCAFQVLADTEYSIAVVPGKAEIQPGDEVTVELKAAGGAYRSARVELTYDTAAFVLKSVTEGEAPNQVVSYGIQPASGFKFFPAPAVALDAEGNQTGKVTLIAISTGAATVLAGQPFASLVFESRSDAVEKTYSFTVAPATVSPTDPYANSVDLDGPFTGEVVIGTDAPPPVSVTGVTLAPKTLELEEGGEATLTATVLPESANNKAVHWSVTSAEPEGAVTVDAYGKVTAVKAGTATVTVTTEDGSFTDSCTVTVTEPAQSHTHSYGAPTWSWASDGKRAEATFTCTGCDETEPGHTETVEADVSVVNNTATCEDAGEITYQARVTFNGSSYAETKTVSSEALGHSWGLTWRWTGTESATATFTCIRDAGHTQTLDATVTSGEEGGNTVYTASVVFNGSSYSTRKTLTKTTSTTEQTDGSAVTGVTAVTSAALTYENGQTAQTYTKTAALAAATRSGITESAAADTTHVASGLSVEAAQGQVTAAAQTGSTITLNGFNRDKILQEKVSSQFTAAEEDQTARGAVYLRSTLQSYQLTSNSSSSVVASRVVYEVQPWVEVTVDDGTPAAVPLDNSYVNGTVTFRLPIPANFGSDTARVTHGTDAARDYSVQTDSSNRYVELDATHFSEFAVDALYTVTFQDADGTTLGTQKVLYGTAWSGVTKPAVSGGILSSWTGAPETVTEDVTVRASYAPDTFTVTFNSDGGTAVTAQSVANGGTVSRPENPTKAGYLFTEWQLDGTAYNFSAPVTRALELTAVWTPKPEPVFTYTPREFTYDSGLKTATVTSSSGVSPNVKYMRNGSPASPYSAGTYEVYASAEETAGYAAKAETLVGTLTIRPAAITEAALARTDFTYDGGEKTVSVSSVRAGTLELEPGEYTVEGTQSATAVNSYTVTVKAAENGNYSGSITLTWRIRQGSAAVSVAPEAETLTYNGLAQSLVTAATAENGTMYYRVGTDGAWTDSIPTASDAGDYAVYYKAVGSSGYADTEAAGPVNVTIRKKAADVTITGSSSTVEYDGTEHSVTGYIPTTDSDYPLTDIAFSGAASAAQTAAGTKYMGLTAAQFANENSNYDVTFTVIDGFQTVTRAAADASSLSVPEPDAVTYDPARTLGDIALTGGWNWTAPATVPAADNSGYAASVDVDDSNYDWSGIPGYSPETHAVVRTLRLTVDKAAVAAPTLADKTYSGALQTADVAASGDYTVTANAGGVDAGTYPVVLTLRDAANYSWADGGEAERTLHFTITRAALTAAVSLSDWSYGAAANRPEVTGNSGGGDVTYTYKEQGADDGTYSTAVPAAVGSYTVRAQIAESSNYTAAEATADFSIRKAALEAAVVLDGWNYGAAANRPEVTGNSGGGSVTYTYKVQGADDGTYSEVPPEDAQNYTVRAVIAETDSYLGATVTADFSILAAITWLDEDGETVLDTTYVRYGDTPVHPDAVKPDTARYTYPFAGWTPAPAPVSANSASYGAAFDEVIRMYKVIFVNYDGSVIDSREYAHDTSFAVVTVPDTPARESETVTDDRGQEITISYTFAGWNPAVDRSAAVTEDTVYTATYTAAYGQISRTVRGTSEISVDVTETPEGNTVATTTTQTNSTTTITTAGGATETTELLYSATVTTATTTPTGTSTTETTTTATIVAVDDSTDGTITVEVDKEGVADGVDTAEAEATVRTGTTNTGSSIASVTLDDVKSAEMLTDAVETYTGAGASYTVRGEVYLQSTLTEYALASEEETVKAVRLTYDVKPFLRVTVNGVVERDNVLDNSEVEHITFRLLLPDNFASVSYVRVTHTGDAARRLAVQTDSQGRRYVELTATHFSSFVIVPSYTISYNLGGGSASNPASYTGDTDDSASMNIWLHKEVMSKFAANGGKLPADLQH